MKRPNQTSVCRPRRRGLLLVGVISPIACTSAPQAISKSERLLALQRLPDLERELEVLALQARERKAALRQRRAAKTREREAKLARGEALDPNETDEYCPDVRVADARESREQREQQEETRHKGRRGGPGDHMFLDQGLGERRLLKEDGTPVQMNTAKWPFSIEDDGATITVDVALPKFLDSAQVRTCRFTGVMPF